MTKVLLKRVGKLTNEEYNSEVKKIARIAISEQAKHNPYIEMFSYRDLIQESINNREGKIEKVNPLTR